VLLAASPIAVVLVGMIGLKRPAVVVTPIAAVYTIVIGVLFFGGTGSGIAASLQTGVLDGVRIILLIFAAFTILVMMTGTGAMDRIKYVIAGLTRDRRVHVLIIAVMLGVFLEGAAGAGTPAAIAAPFLVGLGFAPLVAAAAPLIANSVPVSWGGAGATTIMGIEPISDYMTVMEASAMAGRIHLFGALLLPFLVVALVFGRRGFRGLVPFMLFSGGFMSATLFVLSNFVGPEVTSMGTGLLTTAAALVYLRMLPVRTPDDFVYQPDLSVAITMSPWRAFAPYAILIVMLPVVRYSVPLSVLVMWGYVVWVATVIFVSAYLGSLVLRVSLRSFSGYAATAARKVIPALIAMCSLLTLSDVMVSTGMIEILAEVLAPVAGAFYPALAVAVGALGSFMTGTNLGSNIMFGPMHVQAALSLGQNPITIFAGQNVGGSIGNMICPNNVVAVATTVDILGEEGAIMRRVFPAFLVLLVVYALVTLLYTHIGFPR
jgi:lactate permease